LRRPLLLVLLCLSACISGGGGGGDASGSRNTPSGAPAEIRGDSTLSAVAYDGGNQRAIASTAVEIAPAMMVRDAKGKVISGMPVTFLVMAGDGAITGASTITDVHGVARVGSWTLGAEPGPNQLVARSPGLAEVTFHAEGLPLAGSGRLAVAAGTNNQFAIVGEAVPVDPKARTARRAGASRSRFR
jgi:hypothetical protein